MASLTPDKLIFPGNFILLSKRNRDDIPDRLYFELGEVAKVQSRIFSDAVPIVGEDIESFHLRVSIIQSAKAFNMTRHLMSSVALLDTIQLVDGRVSLTPFIT